MRRGTSFAMPQIPQTPESKGNLLSPGSNKIEKSGEKGKSLKRPTNLSIASRVSPNGRSSMADE